MILILLLTGCASEGPTVEEQTAHAIAQVQSMLIKMKCESKCDMQMPMPGSRLTALEQPTNFNDALISLGHNTVQLVPWLATWGITTKGYDTIKDVVSSFPSGSTSNVTTTTTSNSSTVGATTTTTTGDTTSGDTGSGNTTSGDVASTVGDTIDSSGSGNQANTDNSNQNNQANPDNSNQGNPDNSNQGNPSTTNNTP